MVDKELRDILLSKPTDPETEELVKAKFAVHLQNALDHARFCPDCPHEKVDHPKKNRFRCKWCRCEGTSIKRAIYQRQKGKRKPS